MGLTLSELFRKTKEMDQANIGGMKYMKESSNLILLKE